jgi:hypothetical protein
MGPIPDFPLIRAFHDSSVFKPTGVIIPTPVTATLRVKRMYLQHKKSEKPKERLPHLKERSYGFWDFT